MPNEFLNYFSEKERFAVQWLANGRTKIVALIVPVLKRYGMTPDIISYIGLTLLIPIVLIFTRHPLLGSFLLFVHILVDGIDGAYARLTGTATQGGALTDIFCDQFGLVVVGLCSIQYGLLHPTLGAYYLAISLVMITFIVVQNAKNIPVQVHLRTKYYLYALYLTYGITGKSFMNWFVLPFSILHSFTALQSFWILKRHLNQEHWQAKPTVPGEEPEQTPIAEKIEFRGSALGYAILVACVVSATALGLFMRWV